MKKIFIPLFILAFFTQYIHAQRLEVDAGISQLVSNFEAKYWNSNVSNVVVLGFKMQDSIDKNDLCSYVKNGVIEKLSQSKFKVLDPIEVELVEKDHPWSVIDLKNRSFLTQYDQFLTEKINLPINAYIYGVIYKVNGQIKITAFLLQDGDFNSLGNSSVAFAESGNAPIAPDIASNTQTNEPPEGAPAKILYRGGSDPLKGLDVAEEKKTMQFGKFYALIIGIDQYGGEWPKLQNAVNDAKAFEEVLRSKYSFDEFHALYNEKATRENIIKEFEWMVQNVKPDDNVVIYFSGHGDYKKELNKGYWVPVNATTSSTSEFISNNDIQTYLGGIKSKHTLLISDACFSGDIFRGKTVSIPYEESERYYAKVHNLASRKAITSGGTEPVMDGGGVNGHSIFAYYILKSLESNSNKYYDATQLFESIKIPVINNSTQTPLFQPIKDTGDEGGQFIFVRK